VEQLDELPLYPANHRGRDARRGLDRRAIFVPIFDVPGLELVDLPRADPVVVDVPSHRRVDVVASVLISFPGCPDRSNEFGSTES
jgi:hypothetical protein